MSVILRVGAVKPNNNQEHQYGSGDEATSSYTDADVLDIPLPEHTYQRPLPPTSTGSQTNTGYTGLPYQDHNYGLPPPPSPPRSPTPRAPTPFEDNSIVQMEEEVKTTPLVSVVEEIVEDSITRCICGYLHDDGYMICCDRCSVWQHIDCMGVDRNNIPDNYFCELCQPRILDAAKAKVMQKRKREELAARNVLSDSSATDTDPEEAANALASMGKKVPIGKKKIPKQKRPKNKEKPPLKLKIRKALAQKVKKPGKKEKENVTVSKPPKKLMKTADGQRVKVEKNKKRLPLTLEQVAGDPWNSNFSPWVDAFDYAQDNHYSSSVKHLCSKSNFVSSQSIEEPFVPDQLQHHSTCVSEVKKNRKGLKAIQEIPAGHAIIEYRGKVMLRHEYDKEHALVNTLKQFQPFVLFYSQLDVDICVDARTFGNEARFVRRSCSPNSEVRHFLWHGKLYFVILSKKQIMCGVEVTIPFDYNYKDCSHCVECACFKNSCVVSKYWKKIRNSHKSSQREVSNKRKRQSSGSDLNQRLSSSAGCMSPPLNSPSKSSNSPVKSIPASSPLKFPNVSTLLAASALLDEQPELASQLDLKDSNLLQSDFPPRTPPHSKEVSSRRSSRMSQDSVKDEKSSVFPFTPTKEKTNKSKDVSAKAKGKEKEKATVHHGTEGKRERRLSSRKQSQDDFEDLTDQKSDIVATLTPATENEELSGMSSESQKKMTREERKLDAIMKVFEKMEKREERRKEAMARGDQVTKRTSLDSKIQKKEEIGTNQDFQMDTKEEALEISEGEKAIEVKAEDSGINTSQMDVEVKKEKEDILMCKMGSQSARESSSVSSFIPSSHESRLGSLDSSVKTTRKFGKRKRRRSRAYSTAVIPDIVSGNVKESNGNSLTLSPVSSTVPSSSSATCSIASEDTDSDILKFVKTKKHLFDEWSHKHEDETKQEIFVQCLPNPHGNTMDHLQRRNSTSGGSCLKGSEAGGGSAKKRWLRQAMHDVPAPIAFNHSLSVSTDSGSASPVHGSSSPIAGACLSSPGAGTALDFVTPLKKRRLIRESINNESSTSPSAGVVAESITPNGGIGTVEIIPKANGIKDVYPVLHHSTDDRMFLHKGCPNKNGISDAIVLAVNSDAIVSTAASSFSSPKIMETDGSRSLTDSNVEQDASWKNNFSVISTPTVVPVPVKTYVQPLLATTVPIKFPNLLDRQTLQIESESLIGRETSAAVSLSKALQSNSILNRQCAPSPSSPSISPPLRKDMKKCEDAKASAPPVLLVNSNTYSNVKSNNLMEEDTGKDGCVTAKSIMHENSPATVTVDLNAHDMEPPSSLSDRGNNVVVNLDDSLLSVNLQGSKALDEGAECQVNSSEDIKLFPPTRMQPLVSVSICDNPHTNYEKIEEPMIFPRTSDLAGESVHSVVSNVVDSSNLPKIDSSCDINESRRSTTLHSTVKQASDNCDIVAVDGSRTSTDPNHISSTEAVCVPVVERVVVELDAPCDSVNNISEDEREEQRSNLDFSASVGNSDRQVRKDHEERYTDGFVADSNGELSNCDSAEAQYVISVAKDSLLNDEEVEMADSVVAESSSTSNSVVALSNMEKTMDNNVDSTCSEAKNQSTSDSHTGQDSVCDSNTDSDSAVVIQQLEKHDSVDESSPENLGVSSSEACASQSLNDSDTENKKNEKIFGVGDTENEAISKNTSVVTTNITHSLSIQSSQAVLEENEHGLQLRHSGSGSHSESQACSTPLSQHTMLLMPSSSSTLLASSSVPSVTSPSDILSSEIHELSTTPTTSLHASTATSPISSSSATVKKKVSLLEYRKRLKEKPPSVSESTATSESTLAPQPSSTLPTHLKLSTTLSLFLSGSSPPRSFSSSLSSNSFSSANSSSKVSLSQPDQRKSRMPTLATLPLFKSSDPKKDEKKRLKSKPDKPMSLTDRLRLEFGLEEIDDGPKGKKTEDSEVETSNGAGSESIPPPPPPLPVVTTFSTPSIGGTSSRYSQSAPPRSVQTGYVGSSIQTPNGTHVGFTYQQSVQQQATISSTSLNPNQHISGQISTNFGNQSPALYKPLLQHNNQQQQQHQQPCSAAMSISGLPHKPAMQQASSSHGNSVLQGVNPHRIHSSQSHASSNILRNIAHLPLSLNMPHMSQRQQQHHHHPPTSTRHQQNSHMTQDDPPPPPPPLPPPRLQNHNHHLSLPSSASSSSHKYIHQSSSTKSKSSRAAASSSSYSSSSSSSTSSASSSSTRYPDNRNRY